MMISMIYIYIYNHSNVKFSTVQYRTVQYSTVKHNTVQYSTELYIPYHNKYITSSTKRSPVNALQ